VEQYLDFARDLGDTFAIMDRGVVVAQGAIGELTDETVKLHLTV
jgi:urea transport system ATP-binding protein